MKGLIYLDYYKNAQDNEEMARLAYEHEKYQVSIALACLSVELYLKSVLHLTPHDMNLETSHDVINVYKCLCKRFKPKNDLLSCVVQCRKYFNEARYPASNSDVYTKGFCQIFLEHINSIKDYVNNECVANIDDLMN